MFLWLCYLAFMLVLSSSKQILVKFGRFALENLNEILTNGLLGWTLLYVSFNVYAYFGLEAIARSLTELRINLGYNPESIRPRSLK